MRLQTSAWLTLAVLATGTRIPGLVAHARPDHVLSAIAYKNDDIMHPAALWQSLPHWKHVVWPGSPRTTWTTSCLRLRERSMDGRECNSPTRINRGPRRQSTKGCLALWAFPRPASGWPWHLEPPTRNIRWPNRPDAKGNHQAKPYGSQHQRKLDQCAWTPRQNLGQTKGLQTEASHAWVTAVSRPEILVSHAWAKAADRHIGNKPCVDGSR